MNSTTTSLKEPSPKATPLREIVLDTETTGLAHDKGDRVIEIACLELINYLPTGRSYQTYINPQRDMSEGATKISGITTEFLQDKPLFMHIVDPFLEFIGDSTLVIHNARFDMNFLNMELDRLCRPKIPLSRAIDTLAIAKKKFPGSPASLDALCRRFKINTSARVKHGALIDCELLADVYLELIGGRQVSFDFQTTSSSATQTQTVIPLFKERPHRPSRNFQLSEEEKNQHKEFVKNLKNPLWYA